MGYRFPGPRSGFYFGCASSFCRGRCGGCSGARASVFGEDAYPDLHLTASEDERINFVIAVETGVVPEFDEIAEQRHAWSQRAA